jgi:hypothetical protein
MAADDDQISSISAIENNIWQAECSGLDFPAAEYHSRRRWQLQLPPEYEFQQIISSKYMGSKKRSHRGGKKCRGIPRC